MSDLVERLEGNGSQWAPLMREAAAVSVCGCDQKTQDVIAALQECGYLSPREAKVERDAIRAQTIEECRQVLTDLMNESSSDWWIAALEFADERIRALAKPAAAEKEQT